MYIMPDMIDMGLKENQKWPTKAHRKVAQHIGLCNSRVVTRDSLIEICQAVIAIPKDKIKTVTIMDCAVEFKVPFISLS